MTRKDRSRGWTLRLGRRTSPAHVQPDGHITHVISPTTGRHANVPRFIVAICCLAVLSGCSDSAMPNSSEAPPNRPTGASASVSQNPDLRSPGELTADDASAEAARAAATAGMAAFARPDLPYDQWWAGLEPLLSSQAAQAYRPVDPAQIPATEVTGEANLPAWDTPRVARVGVPTDAGVYLVIVSRSEADPSWRVERLSPPEAR